MNVNNMAIKVGPKPPKLPVKLETKQINREYNKYTKGRYTNNCPKVLFFPKGLFLKYRKAI